MQTDAVIIEINVEFPQKARNISTTWANYIILGLLNIYPKDSIFYTTLGLLGIYPNVSIFYYRDACLFTFTAVLFTVDMKWKQPKCLPADEYIMKLWNIYRVEYFSGNKRVTKLWKFQVKLMELETIILIEVTQVRKTNM